METSILPDGSHTLATGLNTLHDESRTWQSNVTFWKRETEFFDRLLAKNVPSIKTEQSKVQLEHLQNRLFYYRGEVLDELRHNLHQQEKQLVAIIKNQSNADEETYRKQHFQSADSVRSFDKVYRELKHELFEFIEDLG